MKLATKLEIRKMILNQIEPFCINDLYNRIEKIKPVNRGLILQVLNEIYDEGLILYVRLPEKIGNTNYAFVVDNKTINIKEKILQKKYKN